MSAPQSSEIQPLAGRAITRAMVELVTNGSIEVSATAIDKIPRAVRLLPFGTSVYVPSPGRRSLESNLKFISTLHQAGMEAVPHIAARKVNSRKELRAFLASVVQDFGVHRVLVVGGDATEAAGPYADSIALLRDDVLAEAGINEIGVAGYPEGHPRIPPKILREDFEQKLELAARLRIGIEVITQFSFTPNRITEYCAMLSHQAPDVPVYVGLAGPTSMAKLIGYANYCGVSTSVRALSDMGIKTIKLIKHTDPDEQLVALAQFCALRKACNVIGIHVFSFGGLERSAQWMKNHCRESTNGLG